MGREDGAKENKTGGARDVEKWNGLREKAYLHQQKQWEQEREQWQHEHEADWEHWEHNRKRWQHEKEERQREKEDRQREREDRQREDKTYEASSPRRAGVRPHAHNDDLSISSPSAAAAAVIGTRRSTRSKTVAPKTPGKMPTKKKGRK